MAIYERLPQSLKADALVDDEPLVIEGGTLTVKDNFFLEFEGVTVAWPFGSSSLPGFTYNGYEQPLLRGDYLLGITAEAVPFSGFTSFEDLEPGLIPGLRIQGQFLLKENRAENLLEEQPWTPGFGGARLKLTLEDGGEFSRISLDTEQTVLYKGLPVDPAGFDVTQVAELELTFPDADTVVNTIRLTGRYLNPEAAFTQKTVASYYLQPVGRPLQGVRLSQSLNLHLLNYNSSRGFLLLRDLRQTREEGPDLTLALTAFYDERLSEIKELGTSYVRKYMDPYLAYTELYNDL